MIIFAEKCNHMENAQRIQTVIRLRPELMARVKRKAKQEGRSFNSYVESVLEKSAGIEWPTIPKDFKVSEEILNMRCIRLEKPSKEELEADPKLAYLWEKYVEQ